MGSPPLARYRMLDLSRQLPGPFCSTLLADLGMDVLTITAPGDPFGTGIPFLQRNKRSMTLDLKSAAGRDVFLRLARDADVVLEGFRPGVAARLGIDYETLRRDCPRLVYCAISGYGQDGPYRNLVGHDLNYMGYAGALSVTGPRDGAPLTSGVQAADLGGGALLAAFSIAAALHHRRETGQGQLVDVSMTDGVVSWMIPHLAAYFATGRVPERGEERLNGGWPCYGVYETADGGHVTLGALEPQFWANFCRLVGREDLQGLQHAKGADRDRVEAELRELFRTRPRAAWVELLQQADVCAGPVLRLDEVVRDPQLVGRGLFTEVEHPKLGQIPQIAFPVQMSGTPARVTAPPPELGEHTDEILQGLGYDGVGIEDLRRDGVVA